MSNLSINGNLYEFNTKVYTTITVKATTDYDYKTSTHNISSPSSDILTTNITKSQIDPGFITSIVISNNIDNSIYNYSLRFVSSWLWEPNVANPHLMVVLPAVGYNHVSSITLIIFTGEYSVNGT